MLDIKFIKENLNEVKKMLALRQTKVPLESLLSLDEERIKLQNQIDQKRQKRNEIANKISQNPKEKQKLQDEGKRIKKELEILEKKFDKTKAEWQELISQVPNIILAKVPQGKNEKDNVEIEKEGKIPQFDFKPRDHLQLGKNLDILDFESGAKVTGSQFYYLKNEAVFLEIALIKYALDLLQKEGFEVFSTPDLARKRFYTATGYLPRGPEAQTYEIVDSQLGLVATSEVTLAGLHADEILEEGDLPKKYGGFSHCFRVEAGGYGKYSRGLYRVHQFSKVEMYIFCGPKESSKMLEELVEIAKKILRGLEIPFRVVDVCSGDLGAQSARTVDLEAWMPGRSQAGGWGEIGSISNTTDYQARRLGARFRQKKGDVDYLHTLNGTAIAISRALIAILENYQQKDGSVKIPKVLKPHLGFDIIKSE